MSDLFGKLISAYPSSLEQDENLLKSDTEMTTNQRNCLKLRINEKRIVSFIA